MKKKQKSVLITGVSTGLGNALAKEYLENDFNVYGLGRKKPYDIDAENFFFLSCDLTNLDDIKACCIPLFEGLEKLDMVILNAGMLGEIKALHDATVEELKQTIDLNVWANKVLIDLLIDLEIDITQIVGISSGAAVNGSFGWGGYSLSKSGLNMLLKLYSHEMPDTHITALAPGVIETPMVRHIIDEVDDEVYSSARRLKNGPMQTPDTAAKKLFDTLPKLLSYESGSFLDIRSM